MWHGVAASFHFAGPAVVENRLFYAVLALFLLSWLAALLLAADAFPPPIPLAAALLLSSAAVFLLAANGTLAPAALGTLMVLSFVVVVAMRMGGLQNVFKHSMKMP